ncbi:MAG: PLP-dependent aminotransferase family protein [Rhizobiales bacterium]|nr:PLP-dependent aminotransferase family protein [Hyphomicrobiales bacterium]
MTRPTKRRRAGTGSRPEELAVEALLPFLQGMAESGEAPYRALLDRIEAAVRAGRLAPGTRLPAHRNLAAHVGLSPVTVSKAYREAQARGLVTSRVGQGTFVRVQDLAASAQRSRATGLANLGLNIVPQGRQLGDLRAAFEDASRSVRLEDLFSYQPHQGRRDQRDALADWMAVGSFRPSGENLLITNGAQHGIDLAMRISMAGGESSVLVEELTYSGFKALAQAGRVRLLGLPMDEEGVIPEALEEHAARSLARVVYLMPTLQSPTARTMSQPRRERIAEIIARHDLYLIEDDVYGFFFPQKPLPIAALIPERSFYVASLSKCIAPGFRIGMLVVPPDLMDRAVLAMHGTAWMASSVFAELAIDMIRKDRLDAIIREKRGEASARHQLFVDTLFGKSSERRRVEPTGFHVWLDLPRRWSASDFFVVARQRGILITPPEASTVDGTVPRGVRLCLGGVEDRKELEFVLAQMKQLLSDPAAANLPVV